MESATAAADDVETPMIRFQAPNPVDLSSHCFEDLFFVGPRLPPRCRVLLDLVLVCDDAPVWVNRLIPAMRSSLIRDIVAAHCACACASACCCGFGEVRIVLAGVKSAVLEKVFEILFQGVTFIGDSLRELRDIKAALKTLVVDIHLDMEEFNMGRMMEEPGEDVTLCAAPPVVSKRGRNGRENYCQEDDEDDLPEESEVDPIEVEPAPTTAEAAEAGAAAEVGGVRRAGLRSKKRDVVKWNFYGQRKRRRSAAGTAKAKDANDNVRPVVIGLKGKVRLGLEGKAKARPVVIGLNRSSRKRRDPAFDNQGGVRDEVGVDGVRAAAQGAKAAKAAAAQGAKAAAAQGAKAAAAQGAKAAAAQGAKAAAAAPVVGFCPHCLKDLRQENFARKLEHIVKHYQEPIVARYLSGSDNEKKVCPICGKGNALVYRHVGLTHRKIYEVMSAQDMRLVESWRGSLKRKPRKTWMDNYSKKS